MAEMVRRLNLQPGQKLRIKTESEIIIGSFKKLVFGGTCVEVSNPQKLDGTSLGKITRIFECDIVKIVAEQSGDCNEGNVKEKIFNPTITKQQQNRLTKMVEGALYIPQADMNYAEAMKDIEGSFMIGIHAENVDMGRLFNAEFLQIATPSKLFVFDLIQINAKRLFKDLQPVLESDAYLKIAFDSRLLLDNLRARFNLKIASVCDLLVVLSLQRSCEIKCFNGGMEEVFGFNPNIDFNQKIKRPINPNDVKVLSSKVAYLIPLYNQLNQLSLMPKYDEAIDEYTKITSDSLCNEITSIENNKLASIINRCGSEITKNSSVSS